jgi:hypothetical protein
MSFKNEAEKKLKYKSLCIEIQRMWHLKCTIIPVIIGATGIVTRSLRKKFGNYTRKIFDRLTTKDSYTWNITHKHVELIGIINKPLLLHLVGCLYYYAHSV